jgi:type I restriction enzyme S subunit
MATPKLRFKEFDSEWNKIAVGEFSETVTSGSRDWAQYYSESGDKFIRMTNLVRDGINLDLSDLRFVKLPDNSNEGKRTNLQAGDILISITAELGKLGWIPQGLGTAYINQHTALVRMKNEMDSKFIAYELSTEKYNNKLNSLNDSGAKAGLNLSTIRNFELIVPSKQEQTKIASFLSVVDEKISQLTQKHQLFNQYKQGMMQKLFSQQIRFKADDGSEFGEWEKTKFLDLMVDLWDYRGKTPKKLGMDWGDGEIQSLSALNIKKGFIDFDADCHLGSEKLYKTWMNKGDLEKDDIIFTMEAPLGNVALIPDDRKYILSQRVVCFKTNKKMVDNKFLFQLILSDQFQSRIEELATGTTAKGINQKSMQKIEIALPSKEEQTKIANFLSSIDQKIEVVAQQIEQAKTWKKGLLQQMFV